MKVYVLHDVVVGNIVSYHKTIRGAITAMSKHVEKLAIPLERDYEQDGTVDFELRYAVKSVKVFDDWGQS